MLWLIIAILAYFFLALSSLGDKVYLKGKENPKSYVFYVGLLSGLVILLIPFIKDFSLPSLDILIWPILEGGVYILALYSMYYALERFEVSVVVPTMGGLQPIFILLLSMGFFQFTEISLQNIVALIVLIIGTFLISSSGKNVKIKGKELLFSLLPAALFALDVILTKQVFLTEPFLNGLVFMRITSCVVVLFFLLNKKFRKNIFKRTNIKKSKANIFLMAQSAGGLGILLQSYAISLVPVLGLATLNALKGVQYIFLLIMTIIISAFFSKTLNEKFDKKTFSLKLVSIIIIAVGIALLTI